MGKAWVGLAVAESGWSDTGAELVVARVGVVTTGAEPNIWGTTAADMVAPGKVALGSKVLATSLASGTA